MKKYELTYLITPDLSEDDARQLQNKVCSLIQEEGGILGDGSIFLRKRLAYTIKKKIWAYLTSTLFQLNPEKIADLEKKLKAENQILRYILVIKRDYKIKVLKRRPILSPEKSLTDSQAETKKVELKEIEEKLDEILQE